MLPVATRRKMIPFSEMVRVSGFSPKGQADTSGFHQALVMESNSPIQSPCDGSLDAVNLAQSVN